MLWMGQPGRIIMLAGIGKVRRAISVIVNVHGIKIGGIRRIGIRQAENFGSNEHAFIGRLKKFNQAAELGMSTVSGDPGHGVGAVFFEKFDKGLTRGKLKHKKPFFVMICRSERMMRKNWCWTGLAYYDKMKINLGILGGDLVKVLIIDGQGGGLGRQLVAAVKEACPNVEITAVGTNSMATGSMLKAGADHSATGENAVIVGCRKADIIAGPIGIVIADSLYGEITPAMAVAVGQSSARRILIPVNLCDNIVVGNPRQSMNQLVSEAAETIREYSGQI